VDCKRKIPEDSKFCPMCGIDRRITERNIPSVLLRSAKKKGFWTWLIDSIIAIPLACYKWVREYRKISGTAELIIGLMLMGIGTSALLPYNYTLLEQGIFGSVGITGVVVVLHSIYRWETRNE
jgi:FtsH-binding integral membrane protein